MLSGDFDASNSSYGAPRSIAAGQMSSRRSDRILFILAILLNVGLWIVAPHEDPESGSPLQQVLFGLMYVAAFVGVFVERKNAFRLLRVSLPVLLISLLPVISILWSDEAYVTARRSFELFGSTALALYFVCRLGLRVFVETLGLAMIVASLFSLVFIACAPEIGVMQLSNPGSWRGLFVHKNQLGLAMVLGILTIATFVNRYRGTPRILWIVGCILMLLLLIGSRSITSIVAGLVLAFVCPVLLWCRSRQSMKPALIFIVFSSLTVLAAVMLGFGVDDLFESSGKDVTLSGRIELWQQLVNAISDRPILGYGYQSYFTSHDVGWAAPHAHNGPLEVALDLGFVGLFIFAQMFVVGIARASSYFWKSRDLMSSWPLFAMIYALLTSITEDAFSKADFRWVAIVAAFLFATAAVQDRFFRLKQVSRSPEAGLARFDDGVGASR